MNEAKKSLFKGTLVYFIGNALISVLSFLMMPIITGKLSTTQYGTFDFISQTGSLITPFLTLQITDAVFTFFFKSDETEKKSYFTTATLVIATGILFLCTGIIITNTFFVKIDYLILVILFFIGNIIMLLYTRMARSLGRNLDYVAVNLLKAILYIVFQIIFLLVFKLKVESLLLSNILATGISILILEIRLKLRKFFNLATYSKKVLIEMLKFSVPLVPNTLLWWLIASLNVFIVSFTLGLSTNGIYSVAGKFSSILTMIISVFLLAWQESSIKEYKADKSDHVFYNDILSKFINVIFSGVILLIPLVRIVIPFMINKSYYASIPYSPILLVDTALGGLTGFYGSMYAATRKTMGSMKTTIFGVVTNLIIITTLINFIGLYAAVFATMFSNLAIVIARHLTFRKTMGIKLRWKNISILLVELAVTAYIFYLGNLISQIICFIACFLIALFLNRDLIKEIFSFIFSKFGRKKIHE